MKKASLLFFLLLPLTGISQSIITGKIIGITDGDTVKLLTRDSIQLNIRIANIDCPERKQPFYKRAKQFTSNQVFGKKVKLEHFKNDRYGRFICNVIYNDSLNLGKQLLKNGLAWHFTKYSNDKALQLLEDEARKEKLGIWQDTQAIPPWKWRKK